MDPIQLLISIPGPTFLWVFGIFTAACIAAAYFWPDADAEPDLPLPAADRLDPIEVAYCRGGQPAVIQTAAFALYARGLIELVPKTLFGSARLKSRPDAGKPENPVEAAMLEETAYGCKASDLAKGEWLSPQLTAYLEAVSARLQDLGLVKRDAVRSRIALRFWLALLAPALLGGTKLLMGIARDKPVTYLMWMMGGAFVVWQIARSSKQAPPTKLGQRYLKSLETCYAPLKDEVGRGVLPQGTSYAFLLAVFGTAFLSGLAPFKPFADVFTVSSGGGGGFGGDGGGGGGGCGGCGGGG